MNATFNLSQISVFIIDLITYFKIPKVKLNDSLQMLTNDRLIRVDYSDGEIIKCFFFCFSQQSIIKLFKASYRGGALMLMWSTILGTKVIKN